MLEKMQSLANPLKLFCGAEGENNILADDSVGKRKAGDSAKMTWNQII